jgi:hypothetical protein
MAFKYEEPPPIARLIADRALASEDTTAAAEALIRVGLWETELQWAERFCLTGLQDRRTEVRRAALIAIGHLARRHHALQLNLTRPTVRQFLTDPELAGSAQDTLDDIGTYAPIDGEGGLTG